MKQNKLNQTKKSEDEDNGMVRIASRDYEIYNQAILNQLQTHDQIEICVTDKYLEKATYIIRQWEAVGIMPERGYPIRFEKREEDITLKGTNKKQRTVVNRITLTKHHELYRFTKDY